MRIELDSLTKFEKRKAALSEIEDILEDLQGFIGNVQTETKKTVVTLRKLGVLMEADRGTVNIFNSWF